MRHRPIYQEKYGRNLHRGLCLRTGGSLYRWRTQSPNVCARFTCNANPKMYALLCPCTEEPGRWQLTYFDDRGAIGDTRANTPDQVLAQSEVRFGWRLDQAIDFSCRTWRSYQVIEHYDDEAPEPFGKVVLDHQPKQGDVVQLYWLDHSPAHKVRVLSVDGFTINAKGLK